MPKSLKDIFAITMAGFNCWKRELAKRHFISILTDIFHVDLG